ncbi:MAG: ELWxxDGT repeat protein [Vicinamibacteria bacterium]
MTRNATGALALGLLAAVAHAQPAYRVKDVAPGPGGGSGPEQFVAVGGVTYFVASDPANGREVWRTDGTAAGTTLLKDLAPGPQSSSPTDLTEFGGELFFSAKGSLCHSNGSTLGTTCLRPDLSQVGELTVHAGRLFFVAYDDVHGSELWSSDGTPAGTVLVKDIGTAGAGPSELVSLGGLLFFAAHGPGGRELWRSDGSEAGTLQVLDIRPGPGSSSPDGLTVVGSRLFFAADDGTHGREPWSTDIDSSVTALARDVEPGAESSFPEKATAFEGIAYFSAYTDAHGIELWRSDGTPAGTYLLKDLDPGFFSSFPGDLTVFAGALFFGAEEVNDYQLWRSDGTAAGTVPVNPGAELPFELTVSGGRLFFSAEDAAHGRELWVSDGTSAGTSRLDLRPGAPSSNPWNLADVSGRLYFGAVPAGVAGDFAHEPWTSDGSAGGTGLLAPLGAGASASITHGVELDGLFYFAANDETHGFELWRSDGTEAGTTIVRDLVPGQPSSYPEELTVLNGALYFLAVDERERPALWRSDGTAAGTTPVTPPGHPMAGARALARAGSTLFLHGYDAVHGGELWRSDGTPAGTVLVRDLSPGSQADNGPRNMTDVNGTLFFAGYDQTEGYALWKSDGTEAGTVRVDIVLPGPASASLTSLTAIGGRLYFAADDGLHGPEPWVSDGTPLGTRQIHDVQPGPSGSFPAGFVEARGLAFFYANDGTSGYELWRTDGSEAGTLRLGDIRPGPFGSSPTPRTRVGDFLLFGADDGVAGRELWRSDGTPAGTVRVRDIAPGADPSMADTQALVEWGGFAFFPAASGATGHELWRSDGTTAGTVFLQDVVPGPSSSGLVPLAPAGGRLFMRAADSAGPELWALLPEITVANANAPEGTHALVDGALVPRLDVPLAVPFATADNSAVAGSDFQAKSGALTFAPGTSLQTVDVTVLDDVTPETIEQFFVDVSPADAFAAQPRGIVTVTDDDREPALTVDDAAVVEGNSGSASLAFTVRLSAASAATVTAGYATAEGTAAGGADFQAASGTLTFAPGVTALTVPVAVWGDTLDEPDEFFPLRLSLPSGAVVAGHGVGRIRDDDGAEIRLSALDAGMDVTADLAAGPGPVADEDLYLVELSPFESYEVTVDAASGDLGDFGPIVEVLARDMTVIDWAVPTGVGHALSARMMGSSSPSMPTVQRYLRVRSAGCTTDCGADDTYRIRLRETTGRVARFNQTGGQRTFMILHNTTGEFVETEVHWRRADGTFAGANLVSMSPRATMVLPAPETAQGTAGSILVMHKGPLGALAGKAVALEEATGLAFDTPMTTHPR